jgi:hypothetical protein
VAANRVSEILHDAARRMRADYDRSRAFDHRGETGTVRQEIVSSFMAPFLPGHLAIVNSAELITVDRQGSPQCDVVIYDRSTPPFLDMVSYRKLPNECVYGVIEVKSSLDKPQLLDACEKIERVKRLPKAAYHPALTPQTRKIYGKTYEEYCPTVGMIFAFDSTDLRTLGQHLVDWCDDREPELWPDSVWVLGKGYLMWTHPQTGLLDPFPLERSGLLPLEPSGPEEDILFPLAVCLNVYFATAWMRPLNLGAYAGDDSMGTPTVPVRLPAAEQLRRSLLQGAGLEDLD